MQSLFSTSAKPMIYPFQLRGIALAGSLLCASLSPEPMVSLSTASPPPLVVTNKKATNISVPPPAPEKTVYLIRHAESLENVVYKGARRVQAAYASRELPATSDVIDAFKLIFKMFRPSVMNAALSDMGETQVKQLYSNLQNDKFVEKLVKDQQAKNKKGPAPRHLLLVHSPLVRAKQTAYGSVFGPQHLAPNDVINTDGADNEGIMVEELDSLREVNPIEIFGDALMPWRKTKTIDGRIEAFEEWLQSRPEDTLVVVGHSVYFKRMLNLPETFDNCDVWEARYSTATADDGESGATLMFEETKSSVSNILSQGNSEATADLPRGWKSLRRLYQYTPEMQIPEVEEEEGGQ